MADAKTEIGSYICKYSATSGSYTTNGNTVASSKCTITGLSNKAYYYQICATDGVGNISDSKSFTVAATAFCTFTSKDFVYTGDVQTWTVPEGCRRWNTGGGSGYTGGVSGGLATAGQRTGHGYAKITRQ